MTSPDPNADTSVNGRPNPFWDFSLRLYARPGVAPACLALQDRYALDVNIVLYCAWLGAERGQSLAETDLTRIVAAVASWHDAVVRPLRALRVDLKAHDHGAAPDVAESLRAQIKRSELDAECIEQQILFALSASDAAGASRSRSVARDNIHAYAKKLGIQPNSDVETMIEVILDAL